MSTTRRGGNGVVIAYAVGSVLFTLLYASIGSTRTTIQIGLFLAALAALIFSPIGLMASAAIDRVNIAIGRTVSWFVLIAVLISAGNATVRKVLDTSSNAWLEAQWVLFGCVFLLCAPWTLIANEHIRIDIVNNLLSRRVRENIEVVGHFAFLLPLTIVMMVTAWPFFMASWRIGEQSLNAGGLPQYPSKFLVPLGFTLLFLQAISELAKRVAMNRGVIEDTLLDAGGHHAAAEAEAARLKAIAEEEAAKHGLGRS